MTRLRESEADFQQAVIDAARYCGWLCSHFRPARTEKGWRTPVAADGMGFPDLVLVRDRVLFVELKTDTGKLSAEQAIWRSMIEAALSSWLYSCAQGDVFEVLPFEHFVWRPRDWTQIREVLGA